jgi:hypothetical protein
VAKGGNWELNDKEDVHSAVENKYKPKKEVGGNKSAPKFHETLATTLVFMGG